MNREDITNLRGKFFQKRYEAHIEPHAWSSNVKAMDDVIPLVHTDRGELLQFCDSKMSVEGVSEFPQKGGRMLLLGTMAGMRIQWDNS